MPGYTINFVPVVIEEPGKGVFAAISQHLPGMLYCELLLRVRGHMGHIEAAKLNKSISICAGSFLLTDK